MAGAVEGIHTTRATPALRTSLQSFTSHNAATPHEVMCAETPLSPLPHHPRNTPHGPLPVEAPPGDALFPLVGPTTVYVRGGERAPNQHPFGWPVFLFHGANVDFAPGPVGHPPPGNVPRTPAAELLLVALA